MFSHNLLVLVFISLSSFSVAQHCRKVDIDKSSGFCTVPDSTLTPGEMDASLACVSNADRPRAVSDSEKNQILAAYGWPTNTKKSCGEFDHWLPHWMGGSGGTKNIWFEPHAGKFGSRTKDKVELMLWRRVCVDKSMTLAEAKSQYLQGWTRLIPKEMIDVLYALLQSQIDTREITTEIELPPTFAATTKLRLRAPDNFLLKSVTLNGKPWTNFDPKSETISVPAGSGRHFTVIGHY